MPALTRGNPRAPGTASRTAASLEDGHVRAHPGSHRRQRHRQRGLDEAIALAARLGSTLHLLHVVDARLLIAEVSVFAPPNQLLDDWRAAGEKLLAEAVALARSRGVPADSALRATRVCACAT